MPSANSPDQAASRQRPTASSLSTRGLRQRNRVLGHPRKFRLNMKLSAQLYLGLLRTSKLKHRTIGVIVEDALWKYLSKMILSGNIYERLRAAHALVNEVIVAASKIPPQEKKGKTTEAGV